MDPLIKALAPVIAAGLALQQLFELIDPFLDQLSKTAKSYATSIISLVVGFLLAWLGGFQVLGALGVDVPSVVEFFVTGLIISGGTETVNALLKYLGYAKENKKGEAKQRARSDPPSGVSGEQAAENIEKMHV